MGQTVGYTLPAPSGGLNLIDSIDNIPPTDALELINMYPVGARVELRGGIGEYSSITGIVKTLITFPQSDGTELLIAAANNQLRSITAGSSTDITGTAPTSDEWQHVVFNRRLFLVNGSDTGQVHTGTGSFSNMTFTGVALSDLINVSSYKERIYFVQKNSQSVWYGGTQSISGALTELPVDYYLKRGGYLVACGSWSAQTGSLTEDLFYILSSEGELLFYSGSYPGDASWRMVQRYVIGKPLGYRAKVHVENDLWFITSRGIVPTSALFSGTSSVATNAISRKVNQIFQAASTGIPFSYLYNARYWSRGQKVIIQYPTSGANTRLLVINAETGAWCRYIYNTSGVCLCHEIHEDKPYYGANSGKIYLSESNRNDDDGPIPFDIRLGYNFFGDRGTYKKFRDLRPLMKTISGITLSVSMETDFQQFPASDTISTSSADSTPWDTSAWDTAEWPGEESYLYDRYSLSGQGHCGALRIQGSIQDAPLEFNAFEVRFELGGQV